MVDLRKQNKSKTKKPTHRFLDIATYNTRAKFQGKIVNPTLDGAPGSLLFFKQKALFFAKNTSLSRVTHQCFSIKNQYNQAITKFALKSNIQDIHRP